MEAIEMGRDLGILPDYDGLERRRMLLGAPSSVRRILTGIDKPSRVQIATRLIPHYTEKEFRQAMSLLGANQPMWYMDPAGHVAVPGPILKEFGEAVRAWHKSRD